MNAEALAAAVAAGEPAEIAAEVRAWVAGVRERGGDLLALAEELPPLATHASAKVRRAVAEAADLFSDALFDHLAARLEKDIDHFVRVALDHARRRRAARGATKAREQKQGGELDALLARIEKEHGPKARRLAENVGRRTSELYVRRLHHEASKVMTPLQISLSSVRGLASAREVDRGAIAQELDAAAERARYLGAVIAGALDATRTTAPRLRDESIRAIVDAACGQLVDRLGERGARGAIDVDVDHDLRARVDQAALLQALQNVLQNAAEAYPTGVERAAVRVRAEVRRSAAESEIAIVVEDDGAGMDAKEREMLFTPLTSGKPGGSGFGLLVVRKMIEDVHDGRLEIDSAPGRGTRVTMVIPVRRGRR